MDTPRTSPTAASDATLVARMVSEDGDEAVRELYRRWGPRLYGFALGRLHDEQLAEELVQDVFVRLWRSAPRFDPELSSVPAFLFLLARRSAIDLHRRAAARPVTAGTEPPDRVDGPAPHDDVEVGMDLRAALAELDDPHRETLALQLEHDLTVREVADRMGVPVGTAKSRRFHALRALRARLEEAGRVG